jgi:hypothetical protein
MHSGTACAASHLTSVLAAWWQHTRMPNSKYANNAADCIQTAHQDVLSNITK